MRIITKSRKSKPESMFIFEFATKSEFNDIISTIRNMVSLCSELEAKSINSLLDKIESRTDSKYSHDGCELSGFLFANEFADFTEQVIYMAMYCRWHEEETESKNKNYRDGFLNLLKYGYDMICDSHTEPSNPDDVSQIFKNYINTPRNR